MFSSAVLRVAARDLTGAAEAHTYESPARCYEHRGGASKTAPSATSMKEATTYGHQGTRPGHEDDDDRPARWEDHHDHPHGWRWFPVTADVIDLPRSAATLDQEELDAATDAFFTGPMTYTSLVPAAVAQAMRSEDAVTVDARIGGVPVQVPIPAGRVPHKDIPDAWVELRAAYALEVAS